MSNIATGSRSAPSERPSASTSRPSASVSRISTVLPLRATTTSPGRVASGPGRLSVAATMPITRTRGAIAGKRTEHGEHGRAAAHVALHRRTCARVA